MILYLLITSALAQNYATPSAGYAYTTAAEAEQGCIDMGMKLCSAEQVFTVVYGDLPEARPQMCYSGFTSDQGNFALGWFNNDADTCAFKVGWNEWHPSDGHYGAHCCTDDIPATTIESCASYVCGAGEIAVEDSQDIFCPTGTCDNTLCCVAWTAAARYEANPSQWSYVYATGEEAETACSAAHEDWGLCTEQQLEGLGMDGEHICSSGWYKTADGFERGWYIGATYAATGECGAEGWQTWVSPDGKGSAHCCSQSYHKKYYNHLVDDGYSNTFQGAVDYCASTTYTPTVCTVGQLETIAKVEENNMCTSGFYREGMDDTVGAIGWWQGIGATDDGTEVCNGITGLRTWASSTPVAHCCAAYVMEPDLGLWTYEPEVYSEGFASGAAADAECTGMGYDALCTKEQVAWIGTNLQTDLCIVGWVKDGADYGYGWYHTTSGVEGWCGPQETWNDYYNPGTPVAFCCMDEVESITLTQDAYYNGGWDYNYFSTSEAEAMCRDGYSLCSKAQLYTIAEFGVELTDGTTQLEDNICKLGWTSEGEVGWWQGDETSCAGPSGWRTFNNPSGGATYHCCQDFAAEEIPLSIPSAAPSLSPRFAFVQVSSGADYFSQEEAKAACTAYHSEMTLCSAAQMVEVAVNGAHGDDTFGAVDPQTELCHTAWVNTDGAVCEEPKDIGWYRVNPGCGSTGDRWETWHFTDPDRAGAYCCAPSVGVTLGNILEALDCVPEVVATDSPTTDIPTMAPSSAIVTGDYDAISDEVCAALNVDDCTMIYTKDGQYYVNDGGATFYPTCVAFSEVDDASCDYLSFVCGACIGTQYGTIADQGKLLAQAMAEQDYYHSSCPQQGCVGWDGFSPSGFEDKVEYTYCAYDGCYYMNGMETCVCDSNSVDIASDLENLWLNDFTLSQCPDPRSFDELMADQLWVTNNMIDNLEARVAEIPDVQTQLSSAQVELKSIWDTWETDIRQTINSAIDTAYADGNNDLCDELRDILTSLEEIGGTD